MGESHHWYLGFPSNPFLWEKRKCRNTAAKEMISARDFLPGLAPIAPPQNKLDTLLALLLLAPLKLEYSACLQDVFDSLQTSFAFNNALSRHVNYHAQRLAADGGDDAYGTSTDDAEAPGHGLLRTLSSPRTGSLRVR